MQENAYIHERIYVHIYVDACMYTFSCTLVLIHADYSFFYLCLVYRMYMFVNYTDALCMYLNNKKIFMQIQPQAAAV